MILYILKYCLSLIKQALSTTLNKCKLSLPDIIIIIIRKWRWVFAGVRITLLFTISVISPLLHAITHILFAYEVIRPLITYVLFKPWTKKPLCLALNNIVLYIGYVYVYTGVKQTMHQYSVSYLTSNHCKVDVWNAIIRFKTLAVVFLLAPLKEKRKMHNVFKHVYFDAHLKEKTCFQQNRTLYV